MLVVLALVAALPVSTGDELVVNPGFEENATADDPVPGWGHLARGIYKENDKGRVLTGGNLDFADPKNRRVHRAGRATFPTRWSTSSLIHVSSVRAGASSARASLSGSTARVPTATTDVWQSSWRRVSYRPPRPS